MNSKGVTPVVATSLLLLISIATVSTSAIFLSDTVSDVGDAVKDRLGVNQKEDNAELNIEFGYRGSNGNIWIDVTNEGSITLKTEEDGVKLWNIYVDGSKTSWDYAYGAPPNNAVNPGDTITIDVNKTFPSAGNSVTVELKGQYETSSAIVCSNESGGDSC